MFRTRKIALAITAALGSIAMLFALVLPSMASPAPKPRQVEANLPVTH